jgi:SAM-dependent methyltransferase
MLPSNKPYAESCDENRKPILDVLRPLFAKAGTVLEIGSGTGQHAVFFSQQMSHLSWQTSDRREHHPGIRAWLADSPAENLLDPIALDVALDAWPETSFDAVFSANTAHIMGQDEVTAMFRGVAAVLGPGGLFALYGPFNYAGRYTSESNARFDRRLKQRDPRSGIKDVDDLNSLADNFGLALAEDFEMPVNNRILVWTKASADLAGR